MAETVDPELLHAIFKAYDVRGTVPDQIDDDLARRTGGAFVRVTGARTVVVGHDMRPSSPDLAGAFADGATAAGADVILIGLASTDQLYFASGHLGHPGAMFTASHNPAQYNGIKMCRAGAQPIGMETGLAEIRDDVASGAQPTAEQVRHDHPAGRPRGVRRAPAVARARRGPPAQGRGGRGQRDGGLHRAGRLRAARGRTGSRSCRCTSSSTAASRTTRPTPSSPRTSSTSSAGSSTRRPTSGWPSTGTPTVASSSTSRAARSRPRR